MMCLDGPAYASISREIEPHARARLASAVSCTERPVCLRGYTTFGTREDRRQRLVGQVGIMTGRYDMDSQHDPIGC